MPTHVVINLAEAADAPTGVTTNVRDMLIEKGGTTTTRHGFLWRKSRTTNNATVHKYDLVEAFDANALGGGFGIPRETINDIKTKVLEADSVFFCAHGSATSTEEVYTQRGMNVERLCSTAEFTELACLFLGRTKVHELRLIVCFAARSSNPDAVHTRHFLSDRTGGYRHLESSLAYKMFTRLIGRGVYTDMYARLGEVRIDLNQDHQLDVLTQSEEGVIAGLHLSAVSQTELMLRRYLDDMRYRTLKAYIDNNMDLGPLDPITRPEQIWLEAYRAAKDYHEQKARQAAVASDGRLRYRMIGLDLIISFEGQEIYRGPLL